jgi:hypothetical protein
MLVSLIMMWGRVGDEGEGGERETDMVKEDKGHNRSREGGLLRVDGSDGDSF